MLDAVSNLNLWASTVVVLVSDHGFKLGEHGGWSKLSNVEEDTRVPLIVAAPPHVLPSPLSPSLDDSLPSLGSSKRAHNEATSKPYRTSDALVELVDLFPTIADLAGLPSPPRAQNWVLGGGEGGSYTKHFHSDDDGATRDSLSSSSDRKMGSAYRNGGSEIDLGNMQPLEGSSFCTVLLAAATATLGTTRLLSNSNSDQRTGAAVDIDVPWKVAVFSQIARMVGGGGSSGGRQHSGGGRANGRRGSTTASSGATTSGGSGGGLGLMGYSMRTTHFRLTIWVDCGNDLTVRVPL